MEEITNVISNVGFPIACCIFLFYNQNQLQKTFGELNTTLKGIDIRLENLEKEDKQ